MADELSRNHMLGRAFIQFRALSNASKAERKYRSKYLNLSWFNLKTYTRARQDKNRLNSDLRDLYEKKLLQRYFSNLNTFKQSKK